MSKKKTKREGSTVPLRKIGHGSDLSLKYQRGKPKTKNLRCLGPHRNHAGQVARSEVPTLTGRKGSTLVRLEDRKPLQNTTGAAVHKQSTILNNFSITVGMKN